MQETDDIELLRRYVNQNSEEAFAALVTRHLNLVYSVALRHVQNPQHAEEITQAVFVILAKKSGHLPQGVVLSGWLYHAARLTAANFVRSEIQRARREQEASYMQSISNESEPDVWPQLAPLLDAAMAGLGEKDRDAVVLRFYEGKKMNEVGLAMGTNEAAAKKRVNRAVEKLRLFFTKRGVVLPAAVLTAAISANSIQAAPVVLATTATAIALAKGATAPASTLTLIKGVMKTMTWIKIKMTVVVGVAVLLGAGATTVLVAQSQHQTTGRTDLPKSAWNYAGFGSPSATIETLAWSVMHTNGEALLSCITPDYLAAFEKVTAQTKSGVPAEQLLLQMWKPQLTGRSGIRILESQGLVTNQVLLNLSLQGWGKTTDHWIRLQKIDGEWKIDDFDPKGKNGRTGLVGGKTEYGGIGVALGFDPSHAVLIKEVVPNSPASQAGLKPGLILQKIDGAPTTGKTLAECVFLARGAVGSKVFLELVDPELKQTNTVELERQKFTPPQK